jgi:hypothetical protein
VPIQETLEKVAQEIAAGDLGKARDRLHGLLATYPGDLALRRRLGEVYWALQQPAMAGRYWYLEEKKSFDMGAACRAFERHCGHDPLQMLLALKYKGDLGSIRDTFAGGALLELQGQVEERCGYRVDPSRRGAAKYEPERPLAPVPRALVACVAIGLLALVALILIGLYTVATWVY